MNRLPMSFRSALKHHICLCGFAKDAKSGAEVRSSMLQGVNTLADAAATTLGPTGRKVITGKSAGSPKITKDDVTVAKAIALKNRLQNIRVKLVRDGTSRTNEDIGTATVLGRAIAKGGFEKIASGANPIEIRCGVILALNEVARNLKAISQPIKTTEEIEQVASISANGDKVIGELVCEAIREVGLDGVISLKEGKGRNDALEVIDGIKFNSGFLSPYFINASRGGKVEFHDALLLLCRNRISSVKSILPALELADSNHAPLVIMADDIGSEALNSLVLYRLKSGYRVTAIKAPGFGDNKKSILNDIAIATGGFVFGDEENPFRLEDIKLSDLGKVGEVVITKDDTLLLNGKGKRRDIARRVDEIKDQITEASTHLEKKNLRERLANFISGVAVMHVGGASEVEINEKIERINDAVNVTRAAIEEGIVPGGGIALLRCIPCLDTVDGFNNDQKMGVDIVRRALRMPCLTIASNAGVDAAMVVSHVEDKKDDYGYDVLKGEFGSLIEMGIVDPTKVVRTAITDAADVASLLTTTETVNAEKKKNA